MKQSLIKGTVILSTFSILSKLIGILFRVQVNEVIGIEGMGIFNFPILFFGTIIAIMNAPSVTFARMISEADSLNDHKRRNEIFEASKAFMMRLTTVIVLFMILATPVLTTFFWPSSSLGAYLVLIPAPIFLGVITVYKGYYQGIQDLKMISLQQITDAIARVVLGLSAVYILVQFGQAMGAAGAAFGTLAGTLGGSCILWLYHKKKTRNTQNTLNKLHKNKLIKQMIRITIPIGIASIGATLMGNIDSLLIYNRLKNVGFSEEIVLELTGILANTSTLIQVPLVLGASLSLAVLPNVAYAKKQSDQLMKERVRVSLIMYTAVALPAGVGLMMVGRPLYQLIFDLYGQHVYLVEIMSISSIFTIINLGLVTILQAINKEKVPVKHMYIGVVIKSILCALLLSIEFIHIHGAVISTAVAYLIILILNLRAILKVGIKIDYKYTLVIPLFSTAIMMLVVHFTMSLGNSMIFTLLAVGLGALVYGVLMILLKVVSIRSIPILRKLFK